MSDGVGYRLLADFVLLLHVGLVIFVVAGLMLIVVGRSLQWSWVKNLWFRLVHLTAIGIVVLQAWLGVSCPLTILENVLHQRAGDATYSGSFIAYWLRSLLYYEAAAWVFTAAYTVFCFLVVWCWFAVRPRSLHSERDLTIS